MTIIARSSRSLLRKLVQSPIFIILLKYNNYDTYYVNENRKLHYLTMYILVYIAYLNQKVYKYY